MTMDIIERLQAARDYISDPEHWIRGWRWNGIRNCALGAVERAYGAMAAEPMLCNAPETAIAIRLLARATDSQHLEVPHYAIGNFNDTHEHYEVIQLFNRAIEAAIAELVAEAEPEMEMACAD